MIDIGINLTNKQFKGKEAEVIQRAKDAGVTGIILTGTSLQGSTASLAYTQTYPDILYTTAGIHPHNAKTYDENTHNALRTLLQEEKVVAVGECGLDFDRNFSTKAEQIYAFERQLDLASEIGKPLFLHEREAHQDFKQIMRKYPDLIEKSVVHCFTGNRYNLQAYLDMGFHIGITGWVCDNGRGKALQDAINVLPLDRLMIATDAPFLLPRNIQPRPNSRTNEPMYLPFVVKKLAALYNISEAELIEKTRVNTLQFFNLD